MTNASNRPADSSPGPAPGPPTGPALPLTDLRVIEVGTMVAGPYASAILCDLGAEVIKLESPGGDALRRSVKFAGTEHWFSECNRGKKSLGLDLTSPRGQEILWRLVAGSDAILYNLRPDTVPKLGLSYQDLHRVNPRVVAVQVSAFGSEGPWGQRRGTAPTIDGSSGISRINGDQETGPLKPPNLFGDLAAAFFAALGVVAAVRAARLTGQGEHLDVAMTECVSHMLGEPVLTELVLGQPRAPSGNRHDYAAPHGCYPCSGEDRWIAIAVECDADWHRFVAAAGGQAWAGDPDYATMASRLAHRDKLDRDVARWTEGHDADELMVALQSAGVASGVVSSPRRVSTDAQLASRGYFGPVPNNYGPPDPIPRFPGRPERAEGDRSRAPEYSEHAGQILGDLLGLAPAEVTSLYQEGVCFPPQDQASH
jgi:crotonobetainyl-CoA:carnitine CoA-transferase CaiB-like acyl-CoA transferase